MNRQMYCTDLRTHPQEPGGRGGPAAPALGEPPPRAHRGPRHQHRRGRDLHGRREDRAPQARGVPGVGELRRRGLDERCAPRVVRRDASRRSSRPSTSARTASTSSWRACAAASSRSSTGSRRWCGSPAGSTTRQQLTAEAIGAGARLPRPLRSAPARGLRRKRARDRHQHAAPRPQPRGVPRARRAGPRGADRDRLRPRGGPAHPPRGRATRIPGNGPHLVVDIGGGSTELIAGEGHEPRRMESLHLGCVGMSQRHFGDGRITARRMERGGDRGAARARAGRSPVSRRGARRSTAPPGRSGLIGAVIREAGWSPDAITPAALAQAARRAARRRGACGACGCAGLSEDRAPVFAGGVAILARGVRGAGDRGDAGLGERPARRGALRSGRPHPPHRHPRAHRRRRSPAVRASTARRRRASSAPRAQSSTRSPAPGVSARRTRRCSPGPPGCTRSASPSRTASTTSTGTTSCATPTSSASRPRSSSASPFWCARTGASSRRRSSRRSRRADAAKTRRLALILRLAVLLHRSRTPAALPTIAVAAAAKGFSLSFPPGWLAAHPLTAADLAQEREYLARAGLKVASGA